MEFDVEKFITKLKNVDKPEEPFQCNSDGEKYLYNLMIQYSENDGCMTVGDVDCEKFSKSDLDNFCDMYESWINEREKTGRVRDLFCRIEPKSNSEASMFF